MNKIELYKISAINAITLIGIGGYGYLQSSTPSPTSLIPVIIGLALLIMNGGIKKENKIIAHIAILLTLLILLGLIMPLFGAIGRSDNFAVLRVALMMATTVYAIIGFISSFIAARKSKK